MTYKGAIFDLFHTLTGDWPSNSPYPTTPELLGLDPEKWLRGFWANPRKRLTGEERDPSRIMRELIHALDPSVSYDRIRDAVRARLQRFKATLQAIPEENLETLRYLRRAGIATGLISNADVMEIHGWEKSPLCGLFDVEVFSCRVGLLKPEPEIYLACLEQMGVAASQCLFVGDGGSEELVGARDVGMVPVLMSGAIKDIYPDRVMTARQVAAHEIERIPDVLNLFGLDARAVP